MILVLFMTRLNASGIFTLVSRFLVVMNSSVGLLAASILSLIVAGYIAQSRLPPPKPKIVGIDLGTTYSCIAAYQAVTGQVYIFKNKHGKKVMPSIVSFTENGVEIGQDALEKAETHPTTTIYDAKRFIGKNFTDKELEELYELYQFKIIKNNDTGRVYFQVKYEGLDRKVSPEDIGSYIIKDLVKSAEKNISRTITKAVMSVPAEFDNDQRAATKEAARLAGIEVLRIINEPTAAALAYGLHEHSHINNVMVVDLGGGTLDVSLLNVQGGMFITMAMAGNNRLGGQDFNNRLLHYFFTAIEQQFGESLKDLEDIQKLHHEVEAVKINLTNTNGVSVHLPLHSLNHGNSLAIFKINITRDTFEKLNEDLFEKVLEPIKKVLQVTESIQEDVDEVVLFGGSTRIPKIRRIIKEYFNGKEPNVSIDPELAVATGVAIQAGIIGGAWPLQVSAIEIIRKDLKKIAL